MAEFTLDYDVVNPDDSGDLHVHLDFDATAEFPGDASTPYENLQLVSGTWGDSAVTGFTDFADADNLFYPGGSQYNGAIVDAQGISFSVTGGSFAGDDGAGDVNIANFDGDVEEEDSPGTVSNILVQEVSCYTPDTLILTEAGEMRIAGLKVGDRVVTLSGEAKPIRWIGRRSYAGRFIAGNRNLLPVCIRAGALGGGLPKRNLWVSPPHALHLDGLLVPAEALVNGVSIIQAEQVESVTYIHLEFDTHEVIFAEGAPAESFLDDDCRGLFQNAHERSATEDGHSPMAPFAPRLSDGYAVEAIRREIEARAVESEAARAA